ncbi:hypothetical protein GCM10009544_59540 [Streptomyces stramineus]|uniref:Uncharacterized protein n=1 Tax=Streptomyces stramineus TaxID=173861 RepID=A0ABP3L0P9_9ACTN
MLFAGVVAGWGLRGSGLSAGRPWRWPRRPGGEALLPVGVGGADAQHLADRADVARRVPGGVGGGAGPLPCVRAAVGSVGSRGRGGLTSPVTSVRRVGGSLCRGQGLKGRAGVGVGVADRLASGAPGWAVVVTPGRRPPPLKAVISGNTGKAKAGKAERRKGRWRGCRPVVARGARLGLGPTGRAG